ncbi:unnamed protein product, partial [Rotaria sp. Silwood1]
MISVDLNRDQIIDLVVANLGDHTISILFGLGNGDFQAQIKYNVDREPSHVISGDFNNDNKTDIAVLGRLSNHMDVLFGDGNMTFPNRKRCIYYRGTGDITDWTKRSYSITASTRKMINIPGGIKTEYDAFANARYLIE